MALMSSMRRASEEEAGIDLAGAGGFESTLVRVLPSAILMRSRDLTLRMRSHQRTMNAIHSDHLPPNHGGGAGGIP